MKVTVVKDYNELSKYACNEIEKEIFHNHCSVLGLATGGTPLGTYREMAKGFQQRKLDYSRVTTINLDEYVGLEKENAGTYHTYMEKNLFQYVNVSSDMKFIPNGTAEDLQAECERYEKLIEKKGPPDLQILGIGTNGHIGFNEPGTSFLSQTHIVELTDSTRKANARFFTSEEQVPQKAITMGIKTILKSRKIILLASGIKKRNAVRTLLEGKPDEQFPASILSEHPNVMLVVDRAAFED